MILYKLFRIKGEKLFPLYIDHENEIPIGEVIEAKELPKNKNGKIRAYKLNELAYRPGWHLTEIPLADHIGKKQPNGKLYQAKDSVWCEVEVDDNLYNYTDDLATRPLTFMYNGIEFKPIGNILGGFCAITKFTSWEKTIPFNRDEFYTIAKENHANVDVFENVASGEWFIPSDTKMMLVLRKTLENSKSFKRIEEYEIPLRDRCMKTLPKNGYYWYKTNANAKVNWMISSQIKVIRKLSNEEVASICRAHGIEPQPIEED